MPRALSRTRRTRRDPIWYNTRMNNVSRWLVVGALCASGVVAFACGGGGGESGPANTGSASAPEPSSAPSASAAAMSSAAPSATATATAPPPAAPLTIMPMKAVMTTKGKQHTLELKADGSLLADGKAAGKITGAEMDDKDGTAIVMVNGDDTITINGLTKSSGIPKFNAQDAIEVGGATIISIADDGNVTLVGPDGKPDTKGKMKFTGFKPGARRTAALIVFGLLVPTRTSVTAIGTASAASSPAPKK